MERKSKRPEERDSEPEPAKASKVERQAAASDRRLQKALKEESKAQKAVGAFSVGALDGIC